MRVIKILLVVIFIAFPFKDTFAYGIETHAALTQEIFKFYNEYFPQNKFPEALKDYLTDGARREDDPLRWMNHFYDPVYDRGLNDSTWGKGYASKIWSQDSDKQNEIKYKIGGAIASILTAFQQRKLNDISTESNYTWQKAIEYYVRGEPEKAMFALGHVLHLIEDVSVPAHTRNDGHPAILGDEDPYEVWAYRFDRNNISDSVEKYIKDKQPIVFENLNSYFNSMASYSNNNFYSGDTIGIQSGYDKPEPDYFKLENKIPFGMKSDNEFGDYHLLQASGVLAWSISSKQLLEFPVILDESWSRLSTKAIQHGAGVINLFFQEVEKVKLEGKYQEEKKSFLGQLVDSVSGFVGSVFSGGEPEAVIPIGEKQETFEEQLLDVQEEKDVKAENTAVQKCTFDTKQSPSHKNLIINEVAWMGKDGDANAEWIELKNISGQKLNISGYQIIDKSEQIQIKLPANSMIYAGNFYLLERDGDGTVPGFRADSIYKGPLSNNNESLRVFDANCNLVDEVSANPSWPAGDNESKKTMERNAQLSWYTSSIIGGTPKQENSKLQEKQKEETEEISPISPISPISQISPTSSVSQISPTNPTGPVSSCSFNTSKSPTHQKLIINEVAWTGTQNDSNDEWIELRNMSGSQIDISSYQLLDKGEQIKITFENGTKIAAGGFYLLERTDDNTLPSISADKIYSGALANSNEGLRFFDGQCGLLDEVLADSNWPAGDNSTKQTMERKTDFSWQTSSAAGGTPRASNSAGAVSSSGGNSGNNNQNNSQPTDNSTSTATSTPGTTTNHIVLSEIYPDKTGNNYDFIELYNPDDSAVDLSAYSLRIFREGATSSESLAVFNGEVNTQISTEGFFLVGFDKYNESGLKTVDVFRSSKFLPSTQSAKIILQDGDNVIDEYQYDAGNLNDGQSFERKAYADNLCFSSQNNGEFLGNGCDTDNVGDWEIRSSANPQNSQSLPEPRAAPATVTNFNLSYHFSVPTLTMNWNPSSDYTGATSMLSYRIAEINSSSSAPFNFYTTSTIRNEQIFEVGRPYEISVQAVDADGLASPAATSSVMVPSFIDSVHFYQDTRSGANSYLIEFYYADHHFIPDAYRGTNDTWKAVVFYLNNEASRDEEYLGTAQNWTPADTAQLMPLIHNQCAGGGNAVRHSLLLPDNQERCGIGGGLNNSSFNFSDLEDKHLLLKTASTTNDVSFISSTDYLTLAFYSFFDSGGGNQTLKLVAVDRTKYYFQSEPPVHQAPTLASDLNFNLNEGTSRLSILWPAADDADTLQKDIEYELNISTSAVLGDNNWANMGRYVTSTSPFVAAGYQYLVGVRARDDFDLISATASSSWVYPSGVTVLNQSQGDIYSEKWGEVPGPCNYGMDFCYDSRGLQSLSFLNNISFRRANVKISQVQVSDPATIRLVLYSDLNGKPDYNSLLASSLISDVLDPGAEVTFVFNNPVILNADTKYWLALEAATYWNGGSGFKRNSFANILSSGDTIENGNAAYRLATYGDMNFTSDSGRDWFLKLFE